MARSRNPSQDGRSPPLARSSRSRRVRAKKFARTGPVPARRRFRETTQKCPHRRLARRGQDRILSPTRTRPAGTLPPAPANMAVLYRDLSLLCRRSRAPLPGLKPEMRGWPVNLLPSSPSSSARLVLLAVAPLPSLDPQDQEGYETPGRYRTSVSTLAACPRQATPTGQNSSPAVLPSITRTTIPT